MDDCKLVTDLLPSYCDELTSLETNTFIRTHLNSCPNCSKLLAKMQKNQESKQADIRRAEFKAALAVYERNHRTRVLLLVIACALLISLFFIFQACSFHLAIAGLGLNRQQLTVVQEPTTDADGTAFQVVLSQTKKDEAALVFLEKNFLGFWAVSGVEIATPERWNSGVAQITWSEPLFSFYDGEPDITMVLHMIYAGRNAIASFENLPYDKIPGNVTVMATQNASDYYIHVITVLPEGGTNFNILPLLQESGLIS